MDTTTLISALLSTHSPLLPAPLAQRLYLSLAWGVVLSALALAWLAPRAGLGAARLSRWLPPLLLLACLLPGGLSPAYWLGLALRAPSGLLFLLCGWSLWRRYRPQAPGVGPLVALQPVSWGFIALGWILLLDTFALWPVSLYAWGYAPLVLGGVAALGLLPALLRGQPTWAALWLLTVLLHLLLRVPTGNVWDAVLDPALWLWLQLAWLLRRLRRGERRARPGTQH